MCEWSHSEPEDNSWVSLIFGELREKPEGRRRYQPYARTMNSTTADRLRVIGALSGAAFAVLALLTYLINPGPSSGNGVAVVEYYATHATATFWPAALAGIAGISFIWFAETLAAQMSSGPAGVAGASVTAALYLAAIGCWEIVGELYGRVDVTSVSSEDYSNAHVLYDVGLGAAHIGNFAAAAFVGASAAAILTCGAPWRPLGWLGIAVSGFRLVSALIELASDAHWSDLVAIAGFLAFLAWVFAASVMLVVTMQRNAAPLLQAAA
jgi:hypothetical protein